MVVSISQTYTAGVSALFWPDICHVEGWGYLLLTGCNLWHVTFTWKTTTTRFLNIQCLSSHCAVTNRHVKMLWWQDADMANRNCTAGSLSIANMSLQSNSCKGLHCTQVMTGRSDRTVRAHEFAALVFHCKQLTCTVQIGIKLHDFKYCSMYAQPYVI